MNRTDRYVNIGRVRLQLAAAHELLHLPSSSVCEVQDMSYALIVNKPCSLAPSVLPLAVALASSLLAYY